MSDHKNIGPGNELPEPGEVIDNRYHLEEEIAAGGMGVILRARQIRTGRQVAVKLLHPHIAMQEDFAARFKREVTVATLFDHPTIVRVYDVGETPQGALYLVMEYLDGEELKEIITREGPLPLGRVVDMALQLLDALAEAHSRDVVHRDVKPANIFVMKNRHGEDAVKLVDFGIAKLVNSGQTQLTATGRFTGTPSYVAPEIMVRDANTDPKSADVYAAGLLILEMLTGQKVFSGNGVHETILQHLGCPVLIPRAVEETALSPFLRRATAKHPDDRYRDGDEMYLALRQIRSHLPDELRLQSGEVPRPNRRLATQLLQEISRKSGERGLALLRRAPQHRVYESAGGLSASSESLAEDSSSQLGSGSIGHREDTGGAGEDSLSSKKTVPVAALDEQSEAKTRPLPAARRRGEKPVASLSRRESSNLEDSDLERTSPMKLVSGRSKGSGVENKITTSRMPQASGAPVGTEESSPRQMNSSLGSHGDLAKTDKYRPQQQKEPDTDSPSAKSEPLDSPENRRRTKEEETTSRPRVLIMALAALILLVVALVASMERADRPEAVTTEVEVVDATDSAADGEASPAEQHRGTPESAEREPADSEDSPEVSSVDLETIPPGASAWIDGQEVGRTPLEVELPLGGEAVEVVLRSDDHEDKTVELSAADPEFPPVTMRKTIEEEEPDAPTRPSAPPRRAPSPAPEEDDESGRPAESEQRQDEKKERESTETSEQSQEDTESAEEEAIPDEESTEEPDEEPEDLLDWDF